MPNNFVHIGLIKLILPNAKIIDARRNPMDSCFSCFKQYFAKGQHFTYDLDDIARYYKDYLRLMNFWNELFPGEIFTIIGILDFSLIFSFSIESISSSNLDLS